MRNIFLEAVKTWATNFNLATGKGFIETDAIQGSAVTYDVAAL